MIGKNFKRSIVLFLIPAMISGACSAPVSPPYIGRNLSDSRFERGRPCLPLDYFGDFLSKIIQLLFWTKKYGNHQITRETEYAVVEFLDHYGIKDVKVRINQWAPHKEVWRAITNKRVAWPYKFLFVPETLIYSLIGRPFSGLVVSDFYDVGSNTINIYSDEIPIALHEAGHAVDFNRQRYMGTYGIAGMVPGANLFHENMASEEVFFYLEEQKNYDELLHSYKLLYPAYSTYISSYLPGGIFILVGAVTMGHIVGRMKMKEKRQQLIDEKKVIWTEKGYKAVPEPQPANDLTSPQQPLQ